MPINLAAIRSGIKQALGSVDGLNVFDYEALHPQLDAAVVRFPQSIDLRQVFGPTHWNYLIDVTLMVGMSDDVAADNKLEALLAEDGTVSSSVIVALRADPTFNGACQSSDIVTVDTFGMLLDGTALSCNVTLEVMT